MPAAVAGIPAAAGVLGTAFLGSRSAGKAMKAQQQANNEAIAYQREQDAAKKAESASRLADARRSMDAWYSRVGDEGLKRYGAPSWWTPPVKPSTWGGSPVPTQSTMGPANPVAIGTPAAPPQRASLGTLIGNAPLAPQPMTTAPTAPTAPTTLSPTETKMRPQNLSDLAGWSNWERYTR